jgi:hypothetical protein
MEKLLKTNINAIDKSNTSTIEFALEARKYYREQLEALNFYIEQEQERCPHSKWTTPVGPNGETIDYSGSCPDCGKFFYCYGM